MLTASVYFTKEAERDSYEKGAYGDRRFIYDEKFHIEFEDTDDLKEKLANWVARHFDVDAQDFLEYVENEIENNRFDYCQGEDGDSSRMVVNKENPEGWIADYTFYINDVFQKVDYEF